MRDMLIKTAGCLLMLAVAAAAYAAPVGELHRVAFDPTASLRDAQHRTELRITVWYPATDDAVERPIVIGPPQKPLFNVGSAAPDAPFAAGARRPVILLSHGFGGSARVMGWFGIALARDGDIVVAVDHPGNNGVDPMTVPGALLSWERAEDLRVALDAIARDPVVGRHVDLSRLGLAGFSAGGYTSLVAAGARVQPTRLLQFCHAHPDDPTCLPQPEFAATLQDYERAIERPEIRAAFADAGSDHAIAHVRAVFVMAPALVPSLQPASLEALRVPVEIVLGNADTIAPPATNGVVAAKLIPHAVLTRFDGVTHDDFLSPCTDAGRATLPVCQQSAHQDDVHRLTIDAARAFFEEQLGAAQ